MTEREHVERIMARYCEAESTGDREGWLNLFSPDATHEDPVGNPVNKGLEEIGRFWDGIWNSTLRVELTGPPPIVLGNEAIVHMRASMGPEDQRVTVEPIVDHITFTHDGKIASVRAFYTIDTALPQ